jgi:hypothetical protein
MANPVIHVYYKSSDGCICAAQYGTAGDPVEYDTDLNGHDSTLEVPLDDWNELPTGETHKVDVNASPHVVVAMTQAEIDTKFNAERKGITEHSLAKYYLQRQEMVNRGFDTTEIDNVIAVCEADLVRFSA